MTDAAHTLADEDLAALLALDVLEPAEQHAYAPHLAACATCQALVASNRTVVLQLGALAPEVDAPPGAKARLLARARAEMRPAPDARTAPALAVDVAPPERAADAAPGPRQDAHTPRGWSWPRIRWPRWAVPTLGGLAAAAALLVAIPAYQQQVVATVPLTGSVTGEARVVVRRTGAAELELSRLAPPPPGQVYAAWVIRGDTPPVPAGTLASGDGVLALTAPVADGATVAVTEEPSPGGAAPTSSPILVGQVKA